MTLIKTDIEPVTRHVNEVRETEFDPEEQVILEALRQRYEHMINIGQINKDTIRIILNYLDTEQQAFISSEKEKSENPEAFRQKRKALKLAQAKAELLKKIYREKTEIIVDDDTQLESFF